MGRLPPRSREDRRAAFLWGIVQGGNAQQLFVPETRARLRRAVFGAVNVTSNLAFIMTAISIPVNHEQLARRAFEIWCENGRQPGTAEEDWRAAERQLEREQEHVALSAAQDTQDAAE